MKKAKIVGLENLDEDISMYTSKLLKGIDEKSEEARARREQPHLFDDEDCCEEVEISNLGSPDIDKALDGWSDILPSE